MRKLSHPHDVWQWLTNLGGTEVGEELKILQSQMYATAAVAPSTTAPVTATKSGSHREPFMMLKKKSIELVSVSSELLSILGIGLLSISIN